MLNRDAGRLHRVDQVEHAVHGLKIGFGLGDLRANMAVDARHPYAGQGSGMHIGGQHPLVGNAELVVFEAGGDIGVGLWVDVGIDPDAHWRAQAQAAGHLAQDIKFGFAFNIEATNARLQPLAHFASGFANP